jgi:plasmid stabilization system protein ParE
MKELRLAALAEEELGEARDWYEARSPGLGRQFILAIDEVLQGIRENPARYRVVHRGVRRALLRRFLYGVFFREDADGLLVIGVVHLHRHPDTWKRL